MLPHCGQVYWRYISWLFNFWENFLVEVKGDRQAVAFLLAAPYQKQWGTSPKTLSGRVSQG